MIENFEHLYLLILHILMTALFGIYTFRALFKPEGMVKEFNMDQSSVYIAVSYTHLTLPTNREV